MVRYLCEAVLTPNEVGGFDARFPDFDITTQGADLADAVDMAQDMLCLYISASLERGIDIPRVGTFTGSHPKGGACIGIMALVDEGVADLSAMA